MIRNRDLIGLNERRYSAQTRYLQNQKRKDSDFAWGFWLQRPLFSFELNLSST